MADRVVVWDMLTRGVYEMRAGAMGMALSNRELKKVTKRARRSPYIVRYGQKALAPPMTPTHIVNAGSNAGHQVGTGEGGGGEGEVDAGSISGSR